MIAPTSPINLRLNSANNPDANSIPNIPPATSPKLNKTDAGLCMTPRSLSALSVQLKSGAYEIAKRTQPKATKGVIMPQRPDIFSHVPVFVLI
jgi:hypothetical protein